MLKLSYLKIFILITGFMFTACSGTQQVMSQKTAGDIKIDGNPAEWAQLINIKDENISFGFSNDADNLYIMMITFDRNKIMNILRGGLIVWIDPGKSEGKIGVRYPEKPDPGELMEQRKNQEFRDNTNIDKDNPVRITEHREFDPAMTAFLSQQKNLYIINEDNRVLQSYPIDGNFYQVMLKVDGSRLCYELKVPFGNKPLLNYDPKSNPEGKILVNLVSGDFKSPFDGKQKPNGMNGEGMRPNEPPMGNGNPPNGGGDNGPGNSGMYQLGKHSNDPVKYSFEVILNK